MFGASIIVLSLLVSLVPPQSRNAQQKIVFSESYEKAFEEATERGVPVLLLVIEDYEEANEDVWGNAINSPEFVRATLHSVNVMGNRGTEEEHGTVEITENGKRRKVCRRFGSTSCLQHHRNHQGIYRDFARDGKIRTPLVMLVLPDQTIVASLADRHPMQEYLDAFRKAKKQLPGGLTQQEATSIRDGLANARKALEQGDTAAVIRFSLPFVKSDSAASLVTRSAALLQQVEEAGRRELEEIEQLVKDREFVAAVERLDGMLDRYRKSAIERKVKKQRSILTKRREVKAALLADKKEKSALRLLENADKLRDKGEVERADKLYQRILDSFPGTAAAQKVRDRREQEK